LLTAPLALVAVGSGLLVLTVSLTGNAASSPGDNGERTETPAEISARSELVMATALARNRATAAELISSGASVADIPRSATTGLRGDSAISVEEARRSADKLVVGTVKDQFLAWGRHPHPAVTKDVPFLISVIEPDDGGAPIRVAQVTSVVDDMHGVRLSYTDGDPLLEQGVQYALLTVKSDFPDAFTVIRGHDYLITTSQTLVPIARTRANRSIEGSTVSSLALITDQ
jgi:hypothetical protein